MIAQKKYTRVALGGTFDHFHVGHQHFLRFAGQQAESLIIGVTQPHLVQEKQCADQIEPLSIRKKAVQEFCQQEEIQVEVVELSDSAGPTLGQTAIDALAVTELTQAGGEKINQLRKEKSLPPLPLLICQMKRDEHGQIITSTRIRAGEINRQGQVYSDLFTQDQVLTSQQRESLQQPFGQIVLQPSGSVLTAVVGDIVLETFLQQHWPFELGIFDGKTKRSLPTTLAKITDVQVIHNPAGRISTELIAQLRGWWATLNWQQLPVAQLLRIDGEEDLAAVALALLLPLGAHIYYGQPDQGIVEMKVNEELKAALTVILQSN